MKNGYLIFAIVACAGFMFGAALVEYLFGGILMMVGFYGLAMYVPLIDWIVYHFGRLVDLAFYAFTIYATMTMGVTIAMSLTVFSLGYTFVLVPYLQQTYHLRKEENNRKF